ncbi:hypothetical protein EYF80_011805 [Liparis tanakae]|uniref:Uncharacterized protein n=1 Tax=Liparis tanakae TaxID=230148 RepID=A0A4Z2IJW2_9TELE|nr:hypothetical protein EYF80_011805 [Liparis tanakae]
MSFLQQSEIAEGNEISFETISASSSFQMEARHEGCLGKLPFPQTDLPLDWMRPRTCGRCQPSVGADTDLDESRHCRLFLWPGAELCFAASPLPEESCTTLLEAQAILPGPLDGREAKGKRNHRRRLQQLWSNTVGQHRDNGACALVGISARVYFLQKNCLSKCNNTDIMLTPGRWVLSLICAPSACGVQFVLRAFRLSVVAALQSSGHAGLKPSAQELGGEYKSSKCPEILQIRPEDNSQRRRLGLHESTEGARTLAQQLSFEAAPQHSALLLLMWMFMADWVLRPSRQEGPRAAEARCLLKPGDPSRSRAALTCPWLQLPSPRPFTQLSRRTGLPDTTCLLSMHKPLATLRTCSTGSEVRGVRGGGRRLHHGVVLRQVPGHLAHVPAEAAAAQTAPQLLLGRHVAGRQVAVLGPAAVQELGELVHPHLGHALQVLEEARRRVGGREETDSTEARATPERRQSEARVRPE